MSSLEQRIDTVKAENRAALIAYLPVGFPNHALSIKAMETLVDAGVDAIEVGIPYSDPVLDGTTIQLAGTQALQGGTRVVDSFEAVKAVVAAGAPAVTMTYYNPMLAYGLERFADDLAAAGGSGGITPDVTPDVADEWLQIARERDLDTIFLVAPSSTPERISMTVRNTTGFVYAASLMGVTGERAQVGNAAELLVKKTRDAGATRVCVGLGVSTGVQAAEVARYADGVIVGSAFVRALGSSTVEAEALAALRDKAKELVDAVRSSR